MWAYNLFTTGNPNGKKEQKEAGRDPSKGMDYFKSCLEASNTLKQASDETVNKCFDQIVSDLFGNKRKLLQYLFTPKVDINLEMQQIVNDQAKQIFEDELQRLIETKSADSSDENERAIPTLVNIPKHVQSHITSFLSFGSIDQLKNVCCSIAPVAIEELSKCEVFICNAHEIIDKKNADPSLHPWDIIVSKMKRYRVNKSMSFKQFAENEIGIGYQNLLFFVMYSVSITKRKSAPLLLDENLPIGDLLMRVHNTQTSQFQILMMEKTKVNDAILAKHAISDKKSDYYPMRFVQEFDASNGKLLLKHVIPPCTKIKVNDIKNMIQNEIGCDINFYLIDDEKRVLINESTDLSPNRPLTDFKYMHFKSKCSMIYQKRTDEAKYNVQQDSRGISLNIREFYRYYRYEMEENKVQQQTLDNDHWTGTGFHGPYF